MSELLPCPFCGGEAHTYRTIAQRYCAICNEPFCANVGPFDTEAEAIAAWNTRADDYKQAAEYWQRMYEETFAERVCHDTDENDWHFVCSACGYEQNGYEQWNYCPNCGAKVLRNTPKCSETTTKAVG